METIEKKLLKNKKETILYIVAKKFWVKQNLWKNCHKTRRRIKLNGC